jgi:hypothetical protein
VCFVEQDGESYAEFLYESGGVFQVVLGNSDELDFAAAVGFVQTFKKWKCVLAGGTGNFEEREHYRAMGQFVAQGEGMSVESFQFEFGGFGAWG